MSYLRGSYLSGGALTSDETREMAASEASSDRQRANYARYLPQIESLSPAARAELVLNVEAVIHSLRPEARNLVITMAQRTAMGLGQLEAVSTAAQIASVVATLATLGLTVAQVMQQRKDRKAAAGRDAQSSALEQQALRLQIEEQQARVAALKGPQPQINPDGSFAVPNAPTKASPAAIGTGLALAATAAFVLGK